MSYKPDESVLMAYLYGELETNEKEAVENYLQQNPDAQKQLQEMKDVLKLMSHVKDKEVIAPPLLTEHEAPVIALWNTRYFRVIASIAASFLLLLVAGKIIGPEITYGGGELKISFGAKTESLPSAPAVITPSL